MKHAADLVIVKDGTRERIERRPTVEDRDVIAALSEQNGKRLPDRSVSGWFDLSFRFTC
jgi:hypothetical protein